MKAASATVHIDSREEQKTEELNKSKVNQVSSASANQTEVTQNVQNIKKDAEAVDVTQSSGSVPQQTTAQRPRSRPSDKQPVKRGNSSSSQQNQNNKTGESKKLDEAKNKMLADSDEDGDEEYEPQFDEDDDDDEANDEEKRFHERQ